MHWFKKGNFKKYPSTLYISLNKRRYSEVNVASKQNHQELISINSSSSQSEINSDSISLSKETYKVKLLIKLMKYIQQYKYHSLYKTWLI